MIGIKINGRADPLAFRLDMSGYMSGLMKKIKVLRSSEGDSGYEPERFD